MKRITLLLAVTLLSAQLLAQEGKEAPYVNVTFSTLKDLLERSPSSKIPKDFHFQQQRSQGKVNGQRVFAYRVKGPKGARLTKERVFAVMMEGSLYVNPDRPRFAKRADFYKVEWIGTYGYFIDIEEYPVWIDDAFMTNTFLEEKLIDRSTGEIFELTKQAMRRILRNHPALLAAFESEKKKKRMLKPYLRRYHKTLCNV